MCERKVNFASLSTERIFEVDHTLHLTPYDHKKNDTISVRKNCQACEWDNRVKSLTGKFVCKKCFEGRVGNSISYRSSCESVIHQKSSSECSEGTLCLCGKFVCLDCYQGHQNISHKSSCESGIHQKSSSCCFGIMCPCGKFVCVECYQGHLAFSTSHRSKCESGLHQKSCYVRV